MTVMSRASEICLLPPTHPLTAPMSACRDAQTYHIKLPVKAVTSGDSSDDVHAGLLGTIGESHQCCFTVPWVRTAPHHMLSWSSPSWRPPACQNAPKHVIPRRECLTQLGPAGAGAQWGVPSLPHGLHEEDWVTVRQAFQQPLLEPAGTLLPGCQEWILKGGKKPMRAQPRDSTSLWNSSERHLEWE